MRYIILTSLLLFGSSIVFGQETYEPYTNYYSVEGNVNASFAGLGLTPTFGLYRDGHKFDLGLGLKVYDVWQDGPGILGSYLSYKFYPNQRKNSFNLYFGYHNVFSSHNRGKRTPTFYNELTDMTVRPDKVLLWENMIGIGFDFQIGNQFYMITDFCVGVVLDWDTFKDSETQMEVRSTGQARIGLGYNITWKKAK